MKKIDIKKWSGVAMAVGAAIVAFANVVNEQREKARINEFEERISQLEERES